VEGRRGRRGHGQEVHGACRNCGTPLQGEFCHVCGQPSHISRTLGDVWHDFLHGVLHFDNRAWRTLPMLAIRPGALTRRYILGERAKFVSPVALFLFTVFVMFFVFAFAAGPGGSGGLQGRSVTELEADLTEARAGLVRAEQSLAEARQAIGPGAEGVMAGAQTAVAAARSAVATLETETAEARGRRDLYARAQQQVTEELAAARAAGEADAVASLEMTLATLDLAVAGDGREAPNLSITEGAEGLEIDATFPLSNPDDSANAFREIRQANEDGRISINTGIESWDHTIRKKLENPELAWYKIQNTAYKFAWLLAPISLPFMALLFLWKREATLFDHAVFVLYSLSFVSLVMIAAVLLGRFLPEAVAGPIIAPLVGAVPFHMLFQLKGAYALGWWSTIWRTLFLWVFAVVCLSLFFIAIVLLGLVG
jgi:hypothetical protein